MEDLNPPVAEAKTPKAPKAPKARKTQEFVVDPETGELVAQEGAAPVEDGPKAPRAPRKDYGYRVGGIIRISDKDGSKLSGQRKTWYDTLVASEGSTVEQWEEAHKGIPNGKGVVQAPRGWLRFYMMEGYVTLEGGAAPEAKPRTKAKKEVEEAA